jgi:hypothetical protein
MEAAEVITFLVVTAASVSAAAPKNLAESAAAAAKAAAACPSVTKAQNTSLRFFIFMLSCKTVFT